MTPFSAPSCKSLLKKVSFKARTTQVRIHLPFFSLFKLNIFLKAQNARLQDSKPLDSVMKSQAGNSTPDHVTGCSQKAGTLKKILSKITCRLYVKQINFAFFLLRVSNSKKKKLNQKSSASKHFRWGLLSLHVGMDFLIQLEFAWPCSLQK